MIEKIWYQRNPLYLLLVPFSVIFGLFARLKYLAYRHDFFSSTRMPVPVIIVGNLSVGGTGKTPLVIALVEYLRAQGHKPGVVSRGYGGQASSWPQTVTAQSDPQQVGDEAVLIAQRANCPMVVGPDRVAAAQQLLAEHTCDVIVSDDGLQHYRLARDFEFIVLDKERQLGNRWTLPAGPLREGAWRMKTVKQIVVNGEDMLLEPGEITGLANNQTIALDALPQPIHAVAGIGHPQRFFNTLRNMGVEFIPHAFPDHYRYTESDLNFASGCVLMTEKDAVKCHPFAKPHHYYLPVNAKVRWDQMRIKI